MKSLLASTVAVVVLVAGSPAAANQQLLPPWLCDMFPMFCNR